MKDSEELVVGDLIMINTGDVIPADCIAVDANDCSCSEAALTGEPEGLPKESVHEGNINTSPDPFLLQSALVEKGTVSAIVLAVGDNTNQGRAGLSMNIENEQTPLQKKLDSIANGIGKLGVVVAILTFIAIVVTTMIKTFKEDNREFDMEFVSDVANGLVIAITVVVVAVPEGLPLAVTISLAYSVGKMFEENNLVRKLHSSETMGNANEICTDKTGTLTQNKMSVQSSYLEDAVRDGEKIELSSLSSSELV
jgi:Ca2+ transporting ATPase